MTREPEVLLRSNQSLVDLLESDDINVEINNEPQVYQISAYYEQSGFQQLLHEKINVFNILSLNCQSLNAKFEQIKLYVEIYNNTESKISVLCLQETWLSADADLSLLQIPGYTLISSGKTCSAHGGVAIYLHEDFCYNILPYCGNSEVWDGQFLEIYLNDRETINNRKKLIIGNIYRPPRNNVEILETFRNEINMILSDFRNANDIILAGDFNMDLLKFRDNQHTNAFLEMMIANGCIPKITLPTRLGEFRDTLIDNMFIKISHNFSRTTSGILFHQISDHLPCFVFLDYLTFNKNIGQPQRVRQHNPHAYENFKTDLQSTETKLKLDNVLSNDVNESYDKFHDVLKCLVNKHFPVKYTKFNKYKHKRSKWISNGIMKSIAYRDKLYKKVKAVPLENIEYMRLKTALKTYNRILKNSIRVAKKIYFENLFKKFKSDIKNTWATINNIINKTKDKGDFTSKFLVDGQYTSDNQVIVNEFNKYYVEIGSKLASKIQTPRDKSFKDYLYQPVRYSLNFKQVNRDTVLKLIDSLKSKNSCGYDNISTKLLKYVKQELVDSITLIINQSIASGVFPDLLKIAKVTPIYKKGDKHLFENYRPVSVLSSVSKVFEKVLYVQIFDYFSKNKLFYSSQYGFRQNHSTEFAILEVIDRVIKEMDSNRLPVNIYLDLSKAFDTLDHTILLYKLEYYGLRNNTLHLLKSYLDKRCQYTCYNNFHSTYLNIDCGVPQGSILGPLMFIIYMNDLHLATNICQPIIYADDTTLTTSLHTAGDNASEEAINNELHLVQNWLILNKLSLNISKTKGMVFHTRQRTVNYPKLYVQDIQVEFVKNFNFLGIIIDENLSWRDHICFISKKLAKTIGVMNRLKHFLPIYALKNIYNALILSHLNYGIGAWGKYCHKLFGMQKKAIRIVMKKGYFSHTDVLFKKLSILKINDLSALHDYTFCFKFENHLLPDYFLTYLSDDYHHEYYTRARGNRRQPAVSHEFARQAISYKFPRTFNNMPQEVKEKIYTHSIASFKGFVKKRFLDSYEERCVRPDCYVCNFVIVDGGGAEPRD